MTKPFNFSLIMDADVPNDLWDTITDRDNRTESLSGAETIIKHARDAEELGLDTVVIGDHLYGWPDALTTSMAILAATTTLRVGQCVLVNDFRNPVQVAKSIASIDVFSNGRVEYGLGIGYNPNEFRQSGVAFDPPKVRIARLRESIQITKALLSSPDPVTFKGEHYTVEELIGAPRPIQQPTPPLWIGGGGPKMMRLAGEFADVIDIIPQNVFPDGLPADPFQYTAEAFGQKIDNIREGAGDRFDDIRTGCVLFKVVVTDDREAAAAQIKTEFDTAYKQFHDYTEDFPLTVEQILDSPYFYLGTEDEIKQHFVHNRDRFGCNNYLVFGGSFQALIPVIKDMKKDGQ